MPANPNQKKKRIAALAAVTACIKSQEEAMAAQAGAAQPKAAGPVQGAAPLSLWGVSGRQDMMLCRNLMQMKALQGPRRR